MMEIVTLVLGLALITGITTIKDYYYTADEDAPIFIGSNIGLNHLVSVFTY